MANIKFVIEKRVNDRTGQEEDAIVKQVTDASGSVTEDQWCTISELDRLFETCSRRWDEHGWDLEKLITCVTECEFD
jgi:hypothetical protein